MPPTRALGSSSEYTVGWISALPLELAAAKAMLDEEHLTPSDFDQPDNDTNKYTLGRIGNHNVVIAILAAGVYGQISAATTAIAMLQTFPRIRIGLMVGIGAGVPRIDRDRDIRLGDIVVSQPDGRCGGVVQYDLGKLKTGCFERKGSLNMPPEAILKALADLQARHELEPSEVPTILEKMLNAYPLMKKPKNRKPGYSHQGYENDRLFPTTYDCLSSDCGKCDSTQQIVRDDRESTEPEVHYGIIASGNSLIRDAATRDAIIAATEEDCICFEMEAAGLMNSFPCLVVRGISDYADSHKNDRWQRYAAATAAAYAKEFLQTVPAIDLERTRNALEVLKDDLNMINSAVNETKKIVDKMHLDKSQEKVLQWLSAPDPSTNYNKALQQRQSGTGSWFLRGESFTSWKSQQNSVIWLYGIPGCGKTILSSSVIEDLSVLPGSKMIYFYFDFNDANKQTLEGLIRSLISQLYYTYEKLRNPVNEIFSTCKNGRIQPSVESLSVVLLELIDQAGEVWIILDALDECTTRKGCSNEGLLSWLCDLLTSGKRNSHLLVTSRPEQDIQSKLNHHIREENRICIQSDLVKDDISAYVHARVRAGEELKRWQSRPDVQDEIEEILIAQANGMFRWVACQIDALATPLDYPSLRSALRSLPKDLESTYNRILDSIPVEYRQKTIRLLQFCAFGKRPLTIREAVDAIAVNHDEHPSFSPKDRMPDPREITRYCSSLVIIVQVKFNPFLSSWLGSHEELHLSHFSVKEYLTSGRTANEAAQPFQNHTANSAISRTCLAYLLHFDNEIPLNEVINEYDFVLYSAEFWIEHEKIAESGDLENIDLTEQFLVHSVSSYTRWCDVYSIENPEGLRIQIDWSEKFRFRINRTRRNAPSPIYCVAFKGLEKAMGLLLRKHTVHSHAHGDACKQALCAAIKSEQIHIVKELLDNGIDPNFRHTLHGSPIHLALNSPGVQLLDLLLDHGADTSIEDDAGKNVLCMALCHFQDHFKYSHCCALLKRSNVDITYNCFYQALEIQDRRGPELLSLLIKHPNYQTEITERDLVIALKNRYYGQQYLDIILKERGHEVEITEAFLCCPEEFYCSEAELFTILSKKRVDKAVITEKVLIAAAKKRLALLDMLLDERGREIKIPDEVLIEIACTWSINELLPRRSNFLGITGHMVLEVIRRILRIRFQRETLVFLLEMLSEDEMVRFYRNDHCVRRISTVVFDAFEVYLLTFEGRREWTQFYITGTEEEMGDTGLLRQRVVVCGHVADHERRLKQRAMRLEAEL